MSHIYNKHLPWTMVVHFTYTSPTNSSYELWVVYMSHIYNKHLPWTMVVHFTYTSPTNSGGELRVVYMYMSHIYYKHLPWTTVVHFTYTSSTYSTVVSSRWYICLTFITNTYHGQWWSILHTHLLHILQWWALGGLYVSHLLQTLTMDNGGPFYEHISYIFYSGEL
jgi:hypothetical protein